MKTLNSKIALAGLAAAVLTACGSLPDRVETLEDARSSIRTLESDPLAREAAAVDLAEAREALTAADEAYKESEDLELIEHHAYVADRHARIAGQKIAETHARKELENSEAQRTQILLEAREQEARRAEALARQREAQAEIAEFQAELQAARAANAEQRA